MPITVSNAMISSASRKLLVSAPFGEVDRFVVSVLNYES